MVEIETIVDETVEASRIEKTGEKMVENENVVVDNDDDKKTLSNNNNEKTNEWQELMGSDLLLKVIGKNPTTKSETIEPSDAVLIHVEGYVAENKDDETHKEEIFQQGKSWLIVVGDGDVLPAVEMGVRFMETGQTALIWSHSKYAMGPGTRTFQNNVTVPPYSNVMYRVTLIQKVMDTSRLNPYFTIQKALTKKKIANDIYQYEWCPSPQTKDDPTCEQAMNRAIRLYNHTAKEMETLLQGNYFANVEENHPQRVESQQLLLDALNNIVAVHLKQKQYNKAKLASVNVLEKDPHNLKALLRAAKASMLDPASTLEEAEAAIKAAEDDITYKNPEEEEQLKRLKVLFKKKRHEYKTATKSMFGNKLQMGGNKKMSSSGDNKEDDNNTSNSIEESNENTTSSNGTTTTTPSKVVDSGTKTISKEEGEEQGTSDSKLNLEVNDDTSSSFWRTQATAAFVQIVIPLLLYLLYRYNMGSDNGKFDLGLWK